MLRKVTVLMVVLVFFISTLVSASETSDEGAEKTYTLDETLEKISMYKSYLGLKLSDEKIYGVVKKHFPKYYSKISEKEYQKVIEEVVQLNTHISNEFNRNNRIGLIIMILFFVFVASSVLISNKFI